MSTNDLTSVEKMLMAKSIAMAIRNDDFLIDRDVFWAYARATYPLIRDMGILDLWGIYTNDPTI